MKTTTWFITPKTNLHVGNEDTSNYGLIDKMIQRDVITGLPCINASSLKGALNEHCCETMDGETRLRLFGSDKLQKGESRKGQVKFFDARLLFLPMQDDQDLYVLATAVEVINDFMKHMSLFGLTFDIKTDEESLSQWIGHRVKVVDYKLFSEMCSDDNLPIIARNRVEFGESKSLWYEQVLPRESLLYTILQEQQDELSGLLDGSIIQIGANATVGYGYCQFRKVINPE